MFGIFTSTLLRSSKKPWGFPELYTTIDLYIPGVHAYSALDSRFHKLMIEHIPYPVS